MGVEGTVGPDPHSPTPPHSHTPTPPHPHTPLRPILPLYLVIHAGYIGYGMMMTLFVQMLIEPQAGFVPVAATTAYRTSMTGILLALYPLGQFFGTPVLSSLSDRYGRRPVLLASLTSTTFCYMLVTYALWVQSLPLLMGSLLLCGLGEANVAIAQSAIADVSAPADRGRLIGYVYIAVRLGYVVGPLIGGWVTGWTHSYAAPFLVVVVVLALTLLWTHLVFRETHPPDPSRQVRLGAALTSLLTVFTDRPVRLVYGINFLLYVAVFGFSRTILMYLVDRWHFSAMEVTVFYAYFAASVMIANLWVMPALSARFSMQNLAVLSSLVGGALTMLLAFPENHVWLWLLIGPASCLLSLVLSAATTLLSNAVGPADQGRVMGNNEALQVAGQSVGSAAGGFLAALYVPLPLLVFGALVLLGAAVLRWYRIPVYQPAGTTR